MLHPAFIEMIQYASRKKIYTITSTNGQSLTPEIAHAIIESGLDEIVVSMDGLDQDSYEKYRVGGNIDKVKAGIQSMVTWKRDLASKQPEITLQFLVFSHNQHQIEEVKNWGKSAGVDRVVLKTVRIKDKSRENPLLPETKYSRYLQRDNLSYATKGNLKNHCWQSWSKAVITWDGKVLPCCFDVGKNFKMGTVGEKSLLEIWKSKQYGAFRKQILDNRKKYSMCCNCTEGTSYTL